jgi:hypothetical protein
MKAPPGHVKIRTKDLKRKVMHAFSILYRFAGHNISSYMEEPKYRPTHLGANSDGTKIDLYLTLCTRTQTQDVEIIN